jgi:hypothetical protein
MAFPNLTETGPLVFEVPAGPTAGGFTDFWQRPITDSGQTGPRNCNPSRPPRHRFAALPLNRL